MSLKPLLMVTLALLVVVANFALCAAGIVPRGELPWVALIIVLVECAKVVSVAVRHRQTGQGMGVKTLSAVEVITFLLVAGLVVFAALPYDESKKTMLLALCADFAIVRLLGSVALAHYLWK